MKLDFNPIIRTTLIITILSLSQIVQGAEAIIKNTGPLHYEKNETFNKEWRTTCSAAKENQSRWMIANDKNDGKVLRAGFRGNTQSPFDFRVYDSAPGDDISVFDVSEAGCFRAYTDFRMVSGPRKTGEAVRINLAVVSPDGSKSYTGTLYSNNARDIFKRSYLRIDKINFNSGKRDQGRKDNIIFKKSDITFKKGSWYRFEFSMTRKSNRKRSPVNLKISIYELESGKKGGKRGKLLKSVVAPGLPNLGKYVQFGMIGYTTSLYCLYLDNFGVENIISNAASTPHSKPRGPITAGSKKLIKSFMDRRHEYKKSSGKIQLADKGKAQAVIVVPDKSPPPVVFAARELKYFLDKITEAKFKIVKQIPANGKAIILGDTTNARNAGINVREIARDGYRIITDNKKIIIAGKDDASSKSEVLFKLLKLPEDHRRHRLLEPQLWNFERGTLYGVYHFLEMLGVRWFLPGPKGEIIPKIKTLEVPAFCLLEEPTFSQRTVGPNWWEDSRGFARYNKGPKIDFMAIYNDLKFSHKANILWLLRMRGSTMIYPLNHRPPNNQFEERFGKTHPEYFSLWRGKRDLKIQGHKGRTGVLCYSSEGMFQETLKDVDAFFSGKPASARSLTLYSQYNCNKGWPTAVNYGNMVSMLPHDAYKPCECKQCKGKIALGRGKGQMSELVWSFVAKVAKHIEKRWPEHTVSCLAYSSYTALPLTLDYLPDNVIVGICPAGYAIPCYLKNPENYKTVFELIKSWNKMSRAPVAFWFHHLSRWMKNVDHYAVPMLIPHFYRKFIKDLSGYGRIMKLQMDRDNYMFEHLNRYVLMKLLYNPDLDIDLLINDYCKKFYGPATDIVKTILLDIEKRCELIAATDAPRWKIWSDTDMFCPEVIKGYRTQMDKAQTLAKNSSYSEAVRLFSKHFIGFMGKGLTEFQAVAGGAKERVKLAKSRKNILIKVPYSKTGKKMLSLSLMGANDYRNFQKSIVELGYDNQYFNIKLIARENKLENLKMDCRDNKGPVWNDDCFEIMLVPPDSNCYYQIVVNGNGAHRIILKGHGAAKKMIKPENFKIEVTPRIAYDENIWGVEIKIPLAQFPSKDFNKSWRFNIFRSRRINNLNAYQASGIFLKKVHFHMLNEYPKLVWSPK